MKKGIILSAIALCLLALPGKAQEPVRSVEFEMGFGVVKQFWSDAIQKEGNITARPMQNL